MNEVDQFWDVKARERAEERALVTKIEKNRRAMNLGRRASALHNATGFQDFVQAVTDMHTFELRRMAVEPLDDAVLRETRGKVQALRAVLAVLERTDDAVGVLAEQTQELENQLKAVRHARPNPRSE